MEKKDKRVSFGAQVSLGGAHLLYLVYKVFNELHARVLEDVIHAHDGIAPDVEVAVSKVLRHGLH